MIDNQTWKSVLERGLSLDHFFLLCNIKNGIDLIKCSRIQGYINLLTKKGYIDSEGALTEQALDLISTTGNIAGKIAVKQRAVQDWAKEVHTRLQAKLIELTGKKQVVSKVKNTGPGFSFLLNATDLSNKLQKVVSLYKLTDFDRIERTLIKHIETCNDTGSWFPIIGYYIMKDGVSKLVTDMDTLDDEDSHVDEYRSPTKFR